jgi:hypothetical protein
LRNAFLQSPTWKFLVTQFQRQDQLPWPATLPKSNLAPPPSGHQATAMFFWHGKLLPPFLAKLCTGVAPFD